MLLWEMRPKGGTLDRKSEGRDILGVQNGVAGLAQGPVQSRRVSKLGSRL